MSPLTNDNAQLVPKTSFAGPVLEFDFPALKIGVAEYEEGPTGCTVFHMPAGAVTAVDVRGVYSGTFGGYEWNHAICLAGGSLYGLEAVAGVQAELFAQRGYATEWGNFPLVSGAIIYDFGPRDNAVYPDKALGRAALRAAVAGRFPLGPRGAGCSATVGNGFDFTHDEPSGQGAAFRQIGPVKLGVFTVVNALGAIVDRQGHVVRGHRDSTGNGRYRLEEDLERRLESGASVQPRPGNTTLTVVVTNLRLPITQLRQVGTQVHASMARAIQPFHTMLDGDVLYAVTTNEIDDPRLGDTALGVIASELAWDAVLACLTR